jgi:primosomal protein N' (replication factor Y)
VLTGSVDVCISVPKLALDRPFSYLLPDDLEAGTGSLVSVPFHGQTIDGWIVGPATAPLDAHLLPVRKVRSPVRFFDRPVLELLRWVSERYITPLSVVIERSHPPRIAGEEKAAAAPQVDAPVDTRGPSGGSLLKRYGGADRLLAPEAITWLRPLPTEEADACVAAVGACVAAGRRAIVLVPEADPFPHTGRAILDAVGDRAVAFVGGEPRHRYRTWLQIQRGRYDVVVGTRPAVFAPLPDLGLIWISREVHPGHREDRAPYYHVREVAAARARIEGSACVLSSLAPSVETAVACRSGSSLVARPDRAVERAAAPLVESASPQAEDRSPRLARLLKTVKSAALIVSRRGYGVARVCRSCGEPAACSACGGTVVEAGGQTRCSVCAAVAACANCGARRFGVEPGGVERVAEWASHLSAAPVVLATEGAAPQPGTITVGTAASVKDTGTLGLELVAVLDADRALARAGIHAREQALATWMEASAWTRPRAAGGRVVVQTRRPAHPAIQALVRWEPVPFLLSEGVRREEAGFPPGYGVFRVMGPDGLDDGLKHAGAQTVLSAPAEGGTVCLVAVAPEVLSSFRAEILRMASQGTVTRVEAEPQDL